MHNRHMVDTALFDIGFSDEETAFQVQSGLESVIKRDLLDVVDEVFDEATRSGLVIQITRLEVDLGKVSYRDYQAELPRRLRERLSAMLADLHLPDNVSHTSSMRIIDQFHAEYLQLEHFLQNGSLPWYGNPEDDIDWSGILLRVLRDHGQRLKNFLEMTPHRRQVTTRLVSQFDLNGILRLFALLAPAHAGSVSQLMEQLVLAWRDQPLIINALGLDQDAAVRQLWFFLIDIVLGQDGHQYSTQELLGKALSRMLIEKYQISRKLLEAFIDLTSRRRAMEPSPITELLQRLLQQPQAPTDAPQGIDRQLPPDGRSLDEADEVHTGGKGSEWLRSLLAKAIESGDIEAIDAVWDEVISQQLSLFRGLLRRYGQDARIRKRFAYGFSEARLRSLLEMIEPLEHGFVAGVIDQPELFGSRQGQGDARGERTRRQLWEFTLGYLLVERGSRFNKKAYLASLLRQMARSVNLYFGELLDDLLEHLNASVADRMLNRQMRQLLVELRNEQGADSPVREDANASVAIGYLRYERVLQALLHGIGQIGGGERGLVEMIAELRQTHPWLLLRLARELRALPGKTITSLSPDLPPSLLGHLALTLLELMSPDGSELHNAVQRYAERAHDKSQYYRRLLNALIEGELLDFEAILGETEIPDAFPPIAHATPSPLMATELPADPANLDEALLDQRLSQYLQGQITLSERSAAALIRDIGQQLQCRSQPFLERLLAAAGIAQQSDRLVALLPERLLAGIVHALVGQAARHLLQVAELITLAGHALSSAGAGCSLNAIKWSSIFTYLGNTGGLFHEPGFVAHAVAHLTERLQYEDQRQLRNLLVQRLVEDMLPSTRERCLRISEWVKQPAETASLSQAETAKAQAAAESSPVQEIAPQAEVHVTNAGLVLASPYLPRLFEMLELAEKATFKSVEAALRAVHLLQYLVDENTACPEYRLFLNKLLCGVKTDEAVPRGIEPTEQERHALIGLLQGMIGNWKVLGKTSVAGLREAFLQRQGRLQLLNDAWHLRVETRAYDMLLDQLPWSFAIIKHPWMERVIHVEWR
jgi:hypothetical protein